jgi:aspartate kinase
VLIRYTDVDGLYTHDPSTHPDATPIDQLTMTEALQRIEKGELGMHPKTLQPLAEQGIPLRIRSITELDAPGTLIAPQPQQVSARMAS